jgi:hypothetical protein
MYQLLVYYPGDTAPRATLQAQNAAAVVALIPKALSDHDGCERVVVIFNSAATGGVWTTRVRDLRPCAEDDAAGCVPFMRRPSAA